MINNSTAKLGGFGKVTFGATSVVDVPVVSKKPVAPAPAPKKKAPVELTKKEKNALAKEKATTKVTKNA